MNKQLFPLILTAAILLLPGCSGEEAAPRKAAVDVKPAQPTATQAAAQKAAAKAASPGTANGQKPAAAEQKPAASAVAAKATTAAADKPAADKPAPAEKPAAEKNAGQAQTAAADLPPGELLPPLTVPRGYRYEPRGRRDPFVNPVPKPVAEAGNKPVVRPDGLPGVLVNELRISGIIYAEDPAMKKAIVTAGRKTYFAKQGDHLFDAVIKEIRPHEVVFTMVSSATKKPLNRETVVSTGSPSSARR